MKPEKALELLDSAVSQLQANRKTHVKLQQAVQVLQKAIQPQKEKKEKK